MDARPETYVIDTKKSILHYPLVLNQEILRYSESIKKIVCILKLIINNCITHKFTNSLVS